MFKPSLRKSILNDNLCIESQKKHTLFESTNEVKERPVYKKHSLGGESREIVDVPSMMISERLLTQTTFEMDHHPDTKVFTPFIYDFKAYPRAVREFIAPNPNAAQAGKCGEINFVVYEKSLFLWIDNGNNKIPMSSPSYIFPSSFPSPSPSHSPSSQKQSEPYTLLKMHKFSEPIDIAEFSIIKNTKIFTIPKAIVLAIVFKNRMKLFLINEKELFLEDMMLKYQLKGANRIQHVHFTKNNEIIFAGDNGKLSTISLNGNTSEIITVHQSSILARYLSRSAFDYSTVYNIREITSTDNFIYCLYDRIKKENYLLYVIKKAVNKVVKLEKEPKHIVDETFVDVYRYINNYDIGCEKNNKKSIKLIDRISQQLVEQKIKEGYSQFTGENVKDGFRIVAVRGRRTIVKNSNRNNFISGDSLQTNKESSNNNDHTKEEMRGESSQEENNNNNNSISGANDNKEGGYTNTESNGVMEIVTKCGYVIGVVHHTGDERLLINQESQLKHEIDTHHTLQEPSSSQYQYQNTHITFTHQPIKLPSTIGPSHLLEPKLFPSSSSIEKSYRKNFVIKAIQSKEKENNEEMVLLLSDSLMRISKNQEVNVVRFGDLKVNVVESTVEKEVFISADEYERKYNKKSRGNVRNQQQQENSQQQNEVNQSKTLFPHIEKPSTQKSIPIPQPQRHYRLFNHQHRLTSFDNEGRIDIYTLELRHTIIAYISYYLEAKARAEHDQNNSTLSSILNSTGVDYDSRIEKIFEKIISLYGYCRVIKSFLEILTLNLDYNREFIHFQRSLLIDTIRKEFESEEKESEHFSSKSRFEEWNYLVNHHEESQLIVVGDEMIDYVWRVIYELHLRVPLSIEVVSNSNRISSNVIGESSSSLLWQSSQLMGNNNNESNNLPTNENYTAYANALLSLFNEQLQTLSTIRTREFKEQSQTIKSCQSNLINLYELIEKKNKRFMSYHYDMKKGFLQEKQQQQLFIKQSKESFCFNNNTKVNKNDETTVTTYIVGEEEQHDISTNINKTSLNINQPHSYLQYSTQSNSIIESQLLNSISKIVTLVDVMSLLIEKDERQVNQVPSLVSVLTEYKSQLKCGELLFNEELVYLKEGDSYYSGSYYDNSSNNNNNTNIINKVTFLHPELIQRVLKILPELEIDKKIEYLKFKLSRNLITQTSLLNTTINANTNIKGYENPKTLLIDLKSLDLQRLSKLITSTNLPELNRIFLLLSNNSSHHQEQQSLKEFTLERAEHYTEFLTICLTNLLAKTNYLVDVKQSKFNTLSQEVKTATKTISSEQQQEPKSTKPLLLSNHYSMEKIIMAEQKLSHYQSEMIVFYEEVIKVFKSSVEYLAKVTGHEYYEAELYLERIIEMLVCAFPNEEVLIQTVMIILKDANMVDKVHYVRMIRSRIDERHKTRRIFVDLSKEKEERLTERSTFEYLLSDRNRKVRENKNDNTIDTLRYVNNNNSIEQY